MPVVQRSVSIRGPRFYHDGPLLMFVYHYDSFTQDGPRIATNQDMLDHPLALANAERPRQPTEEALAPLVKAVDPQELLEGAPKRRR